MSNGLAIQIEGVTKTFGPKVAVRNLDLSVPEGSLYAFIGPNGAGKTTTIRMIMSIIFPDKGSFRVLGKSSAVESKDRIGYLPEERGVYRKMRVGAFISYMARLKGLDSAAADRKTKEWLLKLGLAETYRKKCEELSKGMQQKVQFITAVIHEPDLLILDEVFSGLDPVNRRLMRQQIEEQHRAGRTIIFSTHAMYEAEQLCDRVVMIHKGEKVLDNTLEEVWKQHDPRTIIVEPLDAGDPSAAWRSLPSVAGIRAVGDVYEVALADGHDAAEALRAITVHTPVRRIELKRPTLEDVFVKMVGGDAAALALEAEELVGSSRGRGGES